MDGTILLAACAMQLVNIGAAPAKRVRRGTGCIDVLLMIPNVGPTSMSIRPLQSRGDGRALMCAKYDWHPV